MSTLINNDTGLAENLSDADASKALDSNTHSVPLINKSGDTESFAPKDAVQAIKSGTHTQPSADDLGGLLKTAKYDTPTEQVKAGLEGALAGVVSEPVASLAEQAVGVKGEDIANRAQVHPITHDVGMGAGLVGSSVADFGLGAVLNTAGTAAKVGLGLEKGALLFGSKAAATIAGAAAAGGVENALFQTQDELSKYINGNPSGSIGLAAMNVGMAGLLGAGIGGALGTVPAAWESMAGTKFVNDFKGRIEQIKDIANPVEHLTQELKAFHEPLQEQALNEVYGSTGLRQQELQKILPQEMTPELSQHNTDTINKIGDALGHMQKNAEEFPAHNIKELQRQYETLIEASQKSPLEAYNALNDFKRYAQGTYKALQRTDSFELPYKFLDTVKGLGKDVRLSLEDAKVWGAAGERTKAINSAWAEFQTPMKEFNSKFSTKLDDTKVIDPGKVNTYLNNVGKPNAEIKQQVLEKYLDAADKFRKVMDDTHANLGIENPLTNASSAMARSTLGEVTAGSQAADWLVHKGVGAGAGGAIGAAIGSKVGAPGIGALIGAKTLSGPINKAFNSIVLPMLQKGEQSAAGARAALEFATAAIKGESKLNNLTEDVFKAGRAIISTDAIKRERLKDKLAELQQKPGELVGNDKDHLGHYLPDHSVALASQKMQAGQYLQALKPNTTPLGPLDAPQRPSKESESRYNAALDIANDPGIVLQKVKNGTVTLNDIKDLQGTNPALLNRMQSKLMEHVIDAQHNKQQIPYKVQQSLSLMFAQPLSASMQPMAIQANQMPAGIQQQPQMPQTGKSGRHNYTGLQKMPNMYQTPQQARQAYRLK